MSSLNEPQVDTPMDNLTNEKARIWRPVAAVLAAVVIAFCGWSAAQYANGQDPLAFLSGSAFQTVAETADEAASGDGAASEPKVTFSTTTVTAADVTDALTKLSFDSTDVSVGSDEAIVVIRDGGIWVEQATDTDASSVVLATARRVSALAAWAKGQNVGFTQVTWISEDAKGAVRMVVRMACDDAPASGDASVLLSAATGYRISGNVYASLDKDSGVAQSSGEAPALPEGGEVTVLESKTADGELLTSTKITNRTLAADEGDAGDASSDGGGSSDGGNGGGSGSGVSSGAASDPGSGSQAGDEGSSSRAGVVTVSITVDGSSAGAGSSSATLELSEGATVYDALAVSGVDFNAKSTVYGLYVNSIAGLAEKDHGSMSGWMYSVNGATAGVACSSYVLSDGDSIYWWYANVEY